MQGESQQQPGGVPRSRGEGAVGLGVNGLSSPCLIFRLDAWVCRGLAPWVPGPTLVLTWARRKLKDLHPTLPQSGGLGFFFYICVYILSVFPSFFQD